MSKSIAISITPINTLSSIGVGKDSHEINKWLKETNSPGRAHTTTKGNIKSLEENLYDSRAFCKLEISKVSMYLPDEWRLGFFQQLDSLMDIDNWEEDEKPIIQDSFRTLLRILLLIKPENRPGIGSTSDGNIIAAWTNDSARLTIECRAHDKVRWVLSQTIDNQRESAAGETLSTRLQTILEPYNPTQWFSIN